MNGEEEEEEDDDDDDDVKAETASVQSWRPKAKEWTGTPRSMHSNAFLFVRTSFILLLLLLWLSVFSFSIMVQRRKETNEWRSERTNEEKERMMVSATYWCRCNYSHSLTGHFPIVRERGEQKKTKKRGALSDIRQYCKCQTWTIWQNLVQIDR